MVAGGREAFIGILVKPFADEIGRGAGAERARLDRDRQRVARDLTQCGRFHPRLRAPHAYRSQHRQPLQPAHEIREEAQRGSVAPLQIVDRHQQRTIRAQIDGEPVKALQERERRVAGHLLAVALQFEDGLSGDCRPG